MVAIIIPHQLSLAPPTCPPSRFQRTASQSTAVRFFVSISPLFVSSNLLSRPLRSASSFPSFRIFVPFGPLFRSLCSVSSFLSDGFFISSSLSARFLLFVSTSYCFVVSSFLSLSSLPFCQVFSSLSNPTHAFQRSRPCPSTFETTPFLPQEHALQRSRTRPSSCVSVSAWFRVSCKAYLVSCPPPCVGVLVCVFVKTFYNPKRLVGYFISHRFSQMNRSLSANRGSTQRRTGPSPVPSPKGRGVITEIPLWLIINT